MSGRAMRSISRPLFSITISVASLSSPTSAAVYCAPVVAESTGCASDALNITSPEEAFSATSRSSDQPATPPSPTA